MAILRNGIYRISLDDDNHLTGMNDGPVVLLPAQNEGQEFEVEGVGGDNYAISKVSNRRPSAWLCYAAGAPAPTKGARVRLRTSDLPSCEWTITQGSQPGLRMVVSGGDLTIGVVPGPDSPPALELTPSANEDRGWIFEFIRDPLS